MKTEVKEIYKCDYCNKLYQRKSAAITHEERCTWNLENDRPCFHCKHLTKKKKSIYEDRWGQGEQEVVLDLLYCDKKEIFLHTPKSDSKGTTYDLGDDSNDPMSKECDIFNKEGNSDLY